MWNFALKPKSRQESSGETLQKKEIINQTESLNRFLFWTEEASDVKVVITLDQVKHGIIGHHN